MQRFAGQDVTCISHGIETLLWQTSRSVVLDGDFKSGKTGRNFPTPVLEGKGCKNRSMCAALWQNIFLYLNQNPWNLVETYVKWQYWKLQFVKHSNGRHFATYTKANILKWCFSLLSKHLVGVVLRIQHGRWYVSSAKIQDYGQIYSFFPVPKLSF